MKALAVVLFLALCAAGWQMRFQDIAFKQQGREIQDLRAKLAETGERAKASSLEVQERCAKQSLQFWKETGFEKEKMAGYTNHFNSKLNKCFIAVSSRTPQANGETSYYRAVQDAFEGKGYAEYMWMSQKGNKYWEVAPFLCKVTLLSGEEKSCKSTEEFDGLIKRYME